MDPKNKLEWRKRQRKFQASRKAEQEFMRHLNAVARNVQTIVKGLYDPKNPTATSELRAALQEYAKTLRPWAKAVVERMHADVNRRDGSMWEQLAKDMGREIRKELLYGETGAAVRKALEEQVHLISSLPLEAAERVHTLTVEGLTQAKRAGELADAIYSTGEVTKSRAALIARTEVARTAAEITKARATAVGCTHYVWRTSGDSDVRKSHKEMNGKVVEYGTAPLLSDGTRTHAGEIYNCRCYQEPVLPEMED